MAGEPKRRHSKSRKRVRRASLNLAVNLVRCKNCNQFTRSHTVCPSCGFYGGQAVSSQKTVTVTKA
ncbi:50S ribosomal protein L32 [Candidatus Daviesbacteria bacterium]|nr:50S ribosomal protein L32 [Candidatus Daviesbacteria bacterium]